MDLHAEKRDSEGIYMGLVSPDNNVYGKLGQTTYRHETHNTGSSSIEKPESCFFYYKVVVVCLVGLCTVLLVAIIVLGVSYRKIQNCPVTNLELAGPNYNKCIKGQELLQKKYNATVKKFSFLDQYCPSDLENRTCRPCPAAWLMFRSHCYYFSNEKKNWSESHIDCIKQGAHLVIIENKEEQEFIKQAAIVDVFWIGLSDVVQQGIWVWVDSTPLEKGFWATRQPDNMYTDATYKKAQPADCVFSMRIQDSWQDDTCGRLLNWVCETEALLL